MDKHINVKICSMSEGLELINNVELIRIKSKAYNLLIMKDYVPVVGDIEGTIEITTEKAVIKKDNIKAYYIHSDNEFNLIMEE